MDSNKHITLTAILIPDEKSSGFTGFFAEMPEVITQGTSQEDTEKNLFTALQTMLQFHKGERNLETGNKQDYSKPNIITKEFDLAVA